MSTVLQHDCQKSDTSIESDLLWQYPGTLGRERG